MTGRQGESKALTPRGHAKLSKLTASYDIDEKKQRKGMCLMSLCVRMEHRGRASRRVVRDYVTHSRPSLRSKNTLSSPSPSTTPTIPSRWQLTSYSSRRQATLSLK